MVTVGIDMGSNRRSVELAGREGVHAAVGIHPNEASDWSQAAFAEVSELATDERVVAIGESGLDFYRDYAPAADQHRAFVAHIELAKRLDKALIIHTRDSLDAALDVLDAAGPPPEFVFHCWSGDVAQMERAVALGASISFAGNISFKNAGNLRAVVPRVPPDRLLVETDSPYLTPAPHRGRPNSPAMVVHVGNAVAEVLGEPPEQVAERTSTNARRVFGIS